MHYIYFYIYKIIIFWSIHSSKSNTGRDTGLLVLLHYDLLTLKIGSEGGLTANWKTNQYNSTKGLYTQSNIVPSPSAKVCVSLQRI